ncbi:MAG: hypothetical protein KIT25_13870 [Enhydrobacter sp.]|nr:MAG: hypothetical protein KIT25_13870 [Enhydrobacter sp.]
MNPLSYLKSRLGRASGLAPGSVFALGDSSRAPDSDSLWRVCHIRDFVGIPHASIEQMATGATKTIAVSALIEDRSFQVVRQAA